MTFPPSGDGESGPTDADLEHLMTGAGPAAPPSSVPSSVIQFFEQARQISDLVPEPTPDSRLSEMFAMRPASAASQATGTIIVEPLRPLLMDCEDLPVWSGSPSPTAEVEEECPTSRVEDLFVSTSASIVKPAPDTATTGLKSMARSFVVDRLDRTSMAAVLATAAVLIIAAGFVTAGLWRDGRGQPTNIVAVDEPNEERPAASSTSVEPTVDPATKPPAQENVTTTSTETIAVEGGEPAGRPLLSDVDSPEGPTKSTAETASQNNSPDPVPDAPTEPTPTTSRSGTTSATSPPSRPTLPSTPSSTAPTSPPSIVDSTTTTAAVEPTPTTAVAPTTTIPATTTTVPATTTTVAPTTTTSAPLVFLAPGWTYVVPDGLAPGIYLSITSEPCEITVVDSGGGIAGAFFAPGELTIIIANIGDQVYTSFGCPGWYQESR